jgi:hydrophobic/amphiphilic exporter-1 (mainly G- bacteria), HAE1 family
MASPADLSIRRPVATAMFYLIIVTVGIVGFRYLPVDLLPAIEFPQLTVRTQYANVGPEEMERLITQPIENAVAGVPNLERVTSNSREGGSWVSLEFSQGTDLAEAANDVRDALERIRGQLPEEADTPRLWKFDPDDIPIVTVAASSSRDLESLTRILERDVIRRFEQIEGVGTIEIRGGIFREIHVDLKRDRLRAAGLTASDVQQAIGRESAIAPGGNVQDGMRDLYVRTLGEYESIEQVRDAVITTVGGAPIRVRDVADVRNDYQDVGRLIEVDGRPVIQFQVRKQSGANTVAVAQSIRDEVERVNLDRPDVHLQVVSDQSTFIQQSIDNVQNSAIWGALLAILVLYFFLRNGSSTFIIALSIPISIIASFALLYFADLSLNQMTFGGLALGIGLIVDNAIVVLENIVRQREENDRELDEAASVGTREVVGAIVASTLTTSVIFLPIMFMQTVTATLFRELALVVVFSLVCSLFVALTLVPMLASRFLSAKKGGPQEGERSSKFRRRFGRFETWYSHRLATALSRRAWVFGGAVVLVVGALGLARFVPVELTPDTDANEVRVNMRMDDGTNLAVVQAYLAELEAIVHEVVPREAVESISSEIWRGRGRIDIALPDPGNRIIDSQTLASDIRSAVVGAVPGADISVRAQAGLWILRRLFSGGGGGEAEAVQLQLRGYDVEQAQIWARRIGDRIQTIPGVMDVRVGGIDDAGPPEQRIRLDRDRIAAAGLSVQEVARAVQLSVGGGRAGYFREGGDEFPITVRLRPEDRLTTIDLDNIAVRTPDGIAVPISAVTTQERARGVSGIRRINGQRVTYIYGELEPGMALGDAVDAIRTELATIPLPEQFSVIFGGEYEEQQRAQRDFMMAIFLALALIYMVMAGQFERFIDPLIVMFSVPLAIVGVVPMLWLTGTTFNIQSLMGLIMLIGIVVNNAIVLVDYINLMRREQAMSIHEAVVEAGRLRLRPILMTTVTTILGLLPLALGIGAGAEIQAALARTVIGGLAASTLITLVLIPVVYVTVYRVRDAVADWIAELRGSAGRSFDPASSA